MRGEHGAPAPLDDVRALLIGRVHPDGRQNPRPRDIYDLVIVGGGPAGIEAALGARRLGITVALIERNELGGLSLRVGSIPSKTLIHVGRLCAEMRALRDFGVSSPAEPKLDFLALQRRMLRVRARVAAYYSIARLQQSGVEVFFGDARFRDPNTLAFGTTVLKFKKAIVATGARAKPPSFSGLDEVGYRTSADIFDVAELPRRLVVIGGGPLGCELAQAFCRLGSQVTIIQNDPKFLPREERDAAELLSGSMARDGVQIMLNTTVVGAHLDRGTRFVDAKDYVRDVSVPADEILLSIGRIPNVESLDLENAGIECDEQRVRVDDFLQTTNRNVYAAGDVCMPAQFTNVAWASARIAVSNALEEKQLRRSELVIPWCTFCDPEIAHVGMQVWRARTDSIPVKTYTVMMQDVDRAITDDQDGGFVKLHVRLGTDEIIGATIVATRASELINEVAVIMSARIGLRDLARVIHTYPAQSEAIRMAAIAYERDQTVTEAVGIVPKPSARSENS